MTASELCTLHKIAPTTAAKRWQRKYQAGLLTRPWSLANAPTDDEKAVVFGADKKTTTKQFRQTEQPPPAIVANDKPATTTKTTTATNKTTLTIRARFVVLVAVMSLCAVVSLENMATISGQIEDVYWVAVALTVVFTVAPFAMLYAGVRGWMAWGVSGICIAYEVFCNATGIYRGLAGLDGSKPYEVWQPGGFVDTVSRVVNIDHKPCALFIAVGMAAMIAAIFLTCLFELRK